MIGLRIGAAELAEIEAGAPAVVLAPGLLLPHVPPLVPLAPKEGVLARPGADTTRSLPLPGWVRPLALVASEHAAERLLPLLPPALPVVPDVTGLLALLAAALRDAEAARAAAAAERDRLKRALGSLAAPLPRRVAELAPQPAAGAAELPVTQPLGRAADGLCGVELHLAGPAGRGLAVRLVAGSRVLGAWRVPAAALAPGWLALDLPEPLPPGAGEAVLEIAAEAGEGTAPGLSLAADRPRASLALRLAAAPPGWAVLPRHFDWAASGAPLPALPLPLPASLLAEAEVEGARAELVGAGSDLPRLVLDLQPGAEARIRLPPAPAGAADLLRLRLARRGPGSGPLAAAVEVTGAHGAMVASGWRELDAEGALALALPLPPGPMPALRIALRHGGTAPVLVELAGLALQAGAAGEARRPPGAEAALPAARSAVSLPGAPAIGASPISLPGWRSTAPAPRLRAAGPGGAAPAAPAVSAPSPAAPPVAPPGGTAFQEVRLNQHLVNPEGTYRHLDIGVAGLVSGGGLWRQIRLKLFERRGVAGLEFREMAGWPQMFDTWPAGQSDKFGPFWRLETEATAEALAALATPHDRALVAALLDVLPDLAGRAAAAAGLAAAETEAWSARARRLAGAVAEARGMRSVG